MTIKQDVASPRPNNAQGAGRYSSPLSLLMRCAKDTSTGPQQVRQLGDIGGDAPGLDSLGIPLGPGRAAAAASEAGCDRAPIGVA